MPVKKDTSSSPISKQNDKVLPISKPQPRQIYLTHKETGKVQRKSSIPQKDHNQYRGSSPREIALAGFK